ncbi:unnamed protein product [Amoebophrya sp. A120]|nr:unnamed protein product [Amoebophrya sp. A120]|eukprot:GSA120T00002623001.1
MNNSATSTSSSVRKPPGSVKLDRRSAVGSKNGEKSGRPASAAALFTAQHSSTREDKATASTRGGAIRFEDSKKEEESHTAEGSSKSNSKSTSTRNAGAGAGKTKSAGEQKAASAPSGNKTKDGAATSKAVTVTKSELSKHFQGLPGFDQLYAPFGKSLRNQATWVLREYEQAFHDAASASLGGTSSRAALPSVGAVAAALKLFREDHDIPFIARYRKVQTEHMNEGHLRAVKKGLQHCDECERKRGSVLLLLAKKNVLRLGANNTAPDEGTKNRSSAIIIKSAVENARNLEELEELYAPYKDSKEDKATQARQLQLEPIALAMLQQRDREARGLLDQFIAKSQGRGSANHVSTTVISFAPSAYSSSSATPQALADLTRVEVEELAVSLAADALFCARRKPGDLNDQNSSAENENADIGGNITRNNDKHYDQDPMYGTKHGRSVRETDVRTSAKQQEIDWPRRCVEYSSTFSAQASTASKAAGPASAKGAKAGGKYAESGWSSAHKGSGRGYYQDHKKFAEVKKTNDKKDAASTKAVDARFLAAVEKYEQYGSYSKPLHSVRGYQYLAIQRGVEAKVLKASFQWHKEERALTEVCFSGYGAACASLRTSSSGDERTGGGSFSSTSHFFPPRWAERDTFLSAILKKCMQRLKLMLQRQYGRELRDRALDEALRQFGVNLAQKLLTPPARLWLENKVGEQDDRSRAGPDLRQHNIRNKGTLEQLDSTAPSSTLLQSYHILALDPGFRQGTKMAVIHSATGRVLETQTLHFPKDSERLREIVYSKYKPRILALGNGSGSQEVEQHLRKLVTTGAGGASRSCSTTRNMSTDAKILDEEVMFFKFLVVDETGASVYSATQLAQQELPDLDVTHRSAVSLARRLVDPLAELCKVPPQSLGVGQYQHSVPEKMLAKEAQSCFEESIAAVGVDLNTCSAELLQYVPGIGRQRALDIIRAREENSGFRTKLDLKKKVKGIGEKVFRECSGFLYVSTAEDLCDRNPHIHPEQMKMVRLLQDAFGGTDLPCLTSVRIDDEDDRNQNYSGREQVEVGKKSGEVDVDLRFPLKSSEGTRRLERALEAYVAKNSNNTKGSISMDGPTNNHDYDIQTLRELCRQLVPASRGGLAGVDPRSERPKPVCSSLVAPSSTSGSFFSKDSSRGGKGTVGARPGASTSSRKLAADVRPGEHYEGVVRNLTEFAAYVDIGVGADAFLHISRFQGRRFQVNEVVRVRVDTNEWKGGKQRISISLV